MSANIMESAKTSDTNSVSIKDTNSVSIKDTNSVSIKDTNSVETKDKINPTSSTLSNNSITIILDDNLKPLPQKPTKKKTEASDEGDDEDEEDNKETKKPTSGIKKTRWEEYDKPTDSKLLDYSPTQNQFVNGFLYSYNHHCPLTITPDNILISIGMTVGKYITSNSELLRDMVVKGSNPNTKEEITVILHNEDWPKFIQLLVESVEGKISCPKIVGALQCDFKSTSTQVSNVVSRVQILSAMKNYFKYVCICECGDS